MLNCSASLAMSTSVLKALPGKLDIKRHSPSILYLMASLAKSTSILKALPGKLDIKRHSPSILYLCSHFLLSPPLSVSDTVWRPKIFLRMRKTKRDLVNPRRGRASMKDCGKLKTIPWSHLSHRYVSRAPRASMKDCGKLKTISWSRLSHRYVSQVPRASMKNRWKLKTTPWSLLNHWYVSQAPRLWEIKNNPMVTFKSLVCISGP